MLHLTSLESRVLEACRELLARGAYPSLGKIAELVGVERGSSCICRTRARLRESGQLDFPLRRARVVSTTTRPKGVSLDGRTPEELAEAEANARRIRDEALASLAHDIPAIRGRVALDVVSSPSLDALPPWKVSRIVRKRTRKVFNPDRRACRA